MTYNEVIEVCKDAATERGREAEDRALKALGTLRPNDAWTAVEHVDSMPPHDWLWNVLMRRALETIK